MLTNEDVTDRTQSGGGKGYLGSRKEDNSEELRGQLETEREHSPSKHLPSLSKTKVLRSHDVLIPSTKCTNVSSTGHSHTGFQRG